MTIYDLPIKKIIIITLSVIFALILTAAVYTLTVYISYLKDREAIFLKIDEFSRVLKSDRETNVTLDGSISDSHASIVKDRNGVVITRFTEEKYKLAPLSEMPFFLIKGFVLIEDKDFFDHNGINLIRITKAFFSNIATMGRSGGGSTISQQLAKNLFTKSERSIKRKIYELFCTFELEKKFSKGDILQIYLNSNYLGHGTYGIANAANFYFKKEPSELTIAEASLLIGMNRSPERYSPINNRENAVRIQKVVINQLAKAKLVSFKGIERELKRFWTKFDAVSSYGEQSIWKTDINKSGYLTEYVRQLLEKEFNYDKITRGGLIVETTFDIEKQLLAEKLVKENIKSIRDKVQADSEKYKKNYTVEDMKKLEGAFTSINFNNGEVYTLVGGSGYTFGNQLNRAVNIKRHIGSSIKPFIYAAALEKGEYDGLPLHPFTKIKDEVITYNVGGKKYAPKNYHANHKYGNMVTLYDALRTSLNTVSVKLLNNLDIDSVSGIIKSAAELPADTDRVPSVLSLALGTAELSPIELAAAYSVFPRDGKTVHPVTVTKISDVNGEVYYDINREVNPKFDFLYPADKRESKQIIKPEISYELTQMMEGVFEAGGTAYWAKQRSGLTKTVYGKSGTTQDYKDGWFAGFSTSEVAVSWVGFDDNKTLLQASESNAAKIWTDYHALVSYDLSSYIEVPRNMKTLDICTESGLKATAQCPKTIKFYFYIDGPLPETCYLHQNKDQDLILGGL